MIFVYSGTGNSYQVARRTADELGLTLVNIPSAVKYERYMYDADGSRVIFVLPTYYGGVPATVLEFARNVRIRNAGEVSCITTCGKNSAGAYEMLSDALGDRVRLDSAYDILMPDNRIIGEEGAVNEDRGKILESASEEIGKVIESIRCSGKGDLRRHALQQSVDHALYDELRCTDNFSVDKSLCIQCRLCAMFCQTGTIVFYDRYPVWDEPECDLCHACLDMCPKKAIDFGEITRGRERWFNPVFYEKSIGIPVKYDLKRSPDDCLYVLGDTGDDVRRRLQDGFRIHTSGGHIGQTRGRHRPDVGRIVHSAQ